MNRRYFFSAECCAECETFNPQKVKIHGIVNTTLNVKTNDDLNFLIKEICKKNGFTEEQKNKFIFTAFNKI